MLLGFCFFNLLVLFRQKATSSKIRNFMRRLHISKNTTQYQWDDRIWASCVDMGDHTDQNSDRSAQIKKILKFFRQSARLDFRATSKKFRKFYFKTQQSCDHYYEDHTGPRSSGQNAQIKNRSVPKPYTPWAAMFLFGSQIVSESA